MTEHSDVLAKLKKASEALDEAQAAAKDTATAVSNAKQAVDKAQKDSQQFDTAHTRTHPPKGRKRLPRKSASKKRS